ncbi:hypothetical protein AGLY_015838 [Aphis glycines]|uniref:Uncharacterized protein n=1 Tax=Aphis glycines TaxID=307491 RepID=A0A6G0T049_APHGL|nr:hypothetical protein AGLY_015838 [Aphis glycines]
MAGPISEMNRLYKYVAPSSPSELIDCSNFTIDFENRKFLNIGFDPKDKFNIVLRLITPARYVNISPDFLKRIYSFMGNILSYILDPVVKYKKFTFLECESVLITKWIIFETVSRKINIVRPNILNQLEQISEYFKTDFNIDKYATLDEVISIIRGIHIELIAKHIPKNKQSFLTQIILFATEQLAINWMTKSRNSLKTVDAPAKFISPTKRKEMHDAEELKSYTETFDVEMLQPSPPRYSSMSPLMKYNEDDPPQSRGADEERGFREYLVTNSMNPLEAAWAPIRKTIPRTIHAVDENDGPTNVYLHIGLDPELLFNCVVCITSNSQCVKMSVELFQSINTLLNNVNFRLPSHLLLKEFKLMSIEEFNGFNILSIKCLQQDQNVQLTKENVKKILQLSDAMEEVIQMKNMYVRSASLLQACKISMFLGKEMPLPKDTNISDVKDYLEHIEVKKLKERISVQGTCLIADLKIKALKQLARGWLSSSPETEAEVNRPRTRAFVAREREKASRRLSYLK